MTLNMDDNLISIGKMAEMSHLTVATLRLYDRLGLIHPKYKDEQSGYRYYDIAQNARLDMIAYMKELGMSLDEIKRVLEQEDIVLIETILLEKNEQLHDEIRKLKAQHDAVENAIGAIERYRKAPEEGVVLLEYIDRRYLHSVPCTTNFYLEGYRAFEKELIKLRRALMEGGFTHAHSYNVGTSISKEDFTSASFIPKDLFVFVGYRDQEVLKGTTVMESNMYASIYLSSFDDEVEYAEKLLEHCRNNNWTICGDYFCEIMTEFNIFDDSRRSMFLRLQVPVKFNK